MSCELETNAARTAEGKKTKRSPCSHVLKLQAVNKNAGEKGKLDIKPTNHMTDRTHRSNRRGAEGLPRLARSQDRTRRLSTAIAQPKELGEKSYVEGNRESHLKRLL